MVMALFATTAGLYAIASGLYVYYLARGTKGGATWASGGATWASRVLGGAVVSHLGYIAVNWLMAGNLPTADIHQALAVLTLALIVMFLVSARWHQRLQVLGAFVTPVTLLLFMGAAFRRGVGPVPPEVRSALVPVHIGTNVLGLAAFAFAFAAGAAYLVQERQLRKKQLGGLFQRLPALDVLDTVGLRAILVGFPLLTVGVVTGTMWAVKLHGSSLGLSAAQGFGLLAWLLFAAVLLLRFAAGWRGRKAAIGAILGFLLTVIVLLGYFVRDALGASA
jgi:ABC-type transport system involved in cytochrome c biogenesis permease subunit